MSDVEVDAWLTDMDGVLVREEQAIPGADRWLALLQQQGRPFMVLTNNSMYTRRALSACLRASGLDCPREVHLDLGPGHREVPAGAAPLWHRLRRRRGGSHHRAARRRLHDDRPQAGLRGPRRDADLQLRADHQRDPRRGRRLPLHRDQSRPDRSLPDGPLPATGAVAAVITRATGVSPYYVGKPNPLMMRSALDSMGAHPESSAMIGDRMDTDIVAGLEAGMHTVLVLTGSTRSEEIDRFPYRPSRIVESIAALADELERDGHGAQTSSPSR